MRPGRFLKRLISPDPDEVDALREERTEQSEAGENASISPAVPGSDGDQPREPVSASGSSTDSDPDSGTVVAAEKSEPPEEEIPSDKPFATEEEQREAGIDLPELFGADDLQSDFPEPDLDPELETATSAEITADVGPDPKSTALHDEVVEVGAADEPDLQIDTEQEETTQPAGDDVIEASQPEPEITVDPPAAPEPDHELAPEQEKTVASLESDDAEDAITEPQPEPESEPDPEPEQEPLAAPELPVKEPIADEELSLARSAVNTGFVITLATELRTPISSLRVSLDLLRDPEATRSNPTESKRLVGNIERSIARLERQASDLLEVGYIHTGSLTLLKQPIVMTEPVLAAIDIAKSPATLRRVSIELEMEPDLPRVIADGFRLTQIMTHLLSNAIKIHSFR